MDLQSEESKNGSNLFPLKSFMILILYMLLQVILLAQKSLWLQWRDEWLLGEAVCLFVLKPDYSLWFLEKLMAGNFTQ